MRTSTLLLIAACLMGCQTEPTPTEPAGPRDGQTRATSNGAFEAWDVGSNAWVSPEAFWASYAERNGGLTWGQRATLPPYAEVNERDLMLLEVSSGVCLMEFWHRRWRRAQDVRRWSPAFNGYGGCPNVFD